MAGLLAVAPFAVSAQDVSLTSRDGSIRLAGDLLSFDGEFYRVDTEYGVLTVDASAVDCVGPGCPDLEAFVADIVLAGPPSLSAGLMPRLLGEFAAAEGLSVHARTVDGAQEVALLDGKRTMARFHFEPATSAQALALLAEGSIDIALSLRDATALERQADPTLTEAHRGRVIALDGLVPLVHAGNPLDTLSIEDLAGVFSGQIANWQDLGGADAPIYPHLVGDDGGIAPAFVSAVMGGQDLADSVVVHPTYTDLRAAVAGDPFAIGIGAYSQQDGTQALGLTGACGFQTRASPASLKTEDYPLTAPLLMFLPDWRLAAQGRDFLTYLRSPAAQEVIAAAGFVDQTVRGFDVQGQGGRLANAIAATPDADGLTELQRMAALLVGHERLSLGFRFDGGSARLDAQSRSNVTMLAQMLEAGLFDGRAVTFVGFSDGRGDALVNRRLSERRARAVRQAVIDAAPGIDGAELAVDGFGEAMPMACDDTDWGRALNRRVEVWVN